METQDQHDQLRVLEPLLPGDGLAAAALAESGLGTRGQGQRLNVNDGELSPLVRIAIALERIADHLAPEPENVVGTDYVARKLGCTSTHVARMVRDGNVPLSCVVPGCGDGRPWKFLRQRIDDWLEMR
jgi:hypothetical protein